MSQKREKKSPKKRGGFGAFIKYTIIGLLVFTLLGGAIAYGIIMRIIADTEEITTYNIENLLAQNSYLYDDQGNLLMNIQRDSVRTIIDYDQISPKMLDAIIAIEDKTFYEHSGFNFVRLIGAIVESVKSGDGPSGTSTITQQYARNMYLPQEKFERNYIRKVKEAHYAIQIEEHMSKEQIITAYLNTIDLGGNVQGVEAASQRYFSKSASELDYIEAAILAGIPKATDTYGPFNIVKADEVTPDMTVLGDHDAELKITFNEQMIPRFKTVILAMLNNDYLTQEEADFAIEYADSKQIVERFHPKQFTNTDITSYFSDMVKEEVVKKLMTHLSLTRQEAENKLYGGGLRVFSTLNLDIQKLLESSYNSDKWSTVFDSETRAAVVSFQQKYSLGLDGVVGPNTLKKLEELGHLKVEDMTLGIYSQGTTHDEVTILKEALEKDGLLFKHNDNLPKVEAYRDYNKNILGLTKDNNENVVASKLILSNFNYVVNGNDEYVIHNGEYEVDAAGNLTLYKNKTLNFYTVTNPDGTSGVEAFIKDVYKANPNNTRTLAGGSNYYAEKVAIKELYIFKGNNILVPFDYKKLDENKNLVISSKFKDDNPDFYTINENGDLNINQNYYSISNTGVIQPQSAMVIIDYHTGQLKAIVGGRNVTGQKIFNRATNPRQPGSSIKPIGVYTPALDNGITAATVYDDVPRYTASGRRWPKNYFDSYGGARYKGIMTVREALHDSNNVVAVKIAEQLGVENLIPYLEKFGISTLVTDGDVNDINLSSVALGGMSKGITPFDITSAYGAIANGGTRNETITFTRIEDKDGNVIVDNIPEQTFVVDEPVAYMMQHIMESGAREGLAKRAAIRPGNWGIPVAGKTGTTSNKNDAWFVGYTPYYVAGMWIGNDIQVSLSDGSVAAADYWKVIMSQIHKDYENKSFKSPGEVGLIAMAVDSKSGKIPTELSYADPEGSTVITEWFIPGTQPSQVDDIHVSVEICSESNKLPTQFCPEHTLTTSVYRLRLDDNYDPYAYGVHYPIADDKYTITRSQYESKVGEGNAYCDIHTEASSWDAQKTADTLVGLRTVASNKGNGERIITASITITTVHGETYNVDAGSRINESGTIIAYDNADPSTEYNVIYPWQIQSASYNPNGPAYNNTETTPTETESESTDDSSQDDVSSDAINDANHSTISDANSDANTDESTTTVETSEPLTTDDSTVQSQTAIKPPANNGN